MKKHRQQPGGPDLPAAQPWPAALLALSRGEAVGFPTETVWGLGVDAASEEAVETLNRLKGRPIGKALQVCCADAAQARKLVAPGQALFESLAALLPGPLTLVARAAETCPAWLVFEGKVGVRVPDHATVQELLRRWGGPLATSSLNLSGQPSARSLEEARRSGLASVVLDGPLGPSSLPSTVIDCHSGEVLRKGAFDARRLRSLLAAPG